MNRLALLSLLAVASCATGYQPKSLTGGFSNYMTAPDEAIVMFHANGYTSMERVIGMVALRCAEITLLTTTGISWDQCGRSKQAILFHYSRVCSSLQQRIRVR